MKSAIRALARARAFSLGVVLTLGLGIAVMVAASSAAEGVFLSPLPHSQGSRLVYLHQSAQGAGQDNALFSVPEIDVYRQAVESFSGVAEFSAMPLTALGMDKPRRVYAGIVTGNYFSVMGLAPILGRVTDETDDGPSAQPVTVLTAETWRTVFNGDPEVLGRTVEINGFPAEIIGVAEPHPPYPERTDLFVNLVVSPHHLSATMAHGWTHRMTEVFARLQPTATLERAGAEVQTVAARLKSEQPDAYEASYGYAVDLRTLQDQLTRRARTVLNLLMATAGIVLLVALANITNLSLARSSDLAEELAVRASLGATARDLRRRLLAENALLAGASLALGLAVAALALPMVRAYTGRFTIRASEIGIHGWSVLLAVAVAAGAAVMLSWIPRLPGEAGLSPLARSGRSEARGMKRTQGALVTAQVAASVVLVFGAGLLARTLVNLQAIDVGIDTEGVVAMDAPSVQNGRTEEEIRDDYIRMIDALEADPAITRAGLTSVLPFQASAGFGTFEPEFLLDGAPAPEDALQQTAGLRVITDGLFDASECPSARAVTSTEATTRRRPRWCS